MRRRPALLALSAALGLVGVAGFTNVQAQPGAPRLVLPVACVVGRSCEIQNYTDHDPGPGARDYRCSTRTYQGHDGVDIRLLDLAAQRRGVAVLAAAGGRVARLRDGVEDVSVRSPGQAAAVKNQECGNGVVVDHGGGWETQYCHLAKGSIAVKVGQAVTAGQPIAKVGLSGSTEYPHLHLSVRQGSRGVDPFAPSLAPGGCDPKAGPGLWTPAAAQALGYKAGAILNIGFSAGAVAMEAVESGQVAPPARGGAALIAYVRAISLEGGDQLALTLTAPGGRVLVDRRSEVMNRAKAQYLFYAGARPPAQGWPAGTYSARAAILRSGKAVASRTFEVRL
jgi:hypothetical protein